MVLLLGTGWGKALADDSTNYVLTQETLNKTLGALSDLRSQNLPTRIGGGNLFTPEQIELVRHWMPDLETLLTPPQ